MSYVECMECRDKLRGITANHLKKHGLTTIGYRRKYPTAPLVSDDLKKRYAINRGALQLKRKCRKCGKPFTTGCPKAHYCRECQRVRDVYRARRKALRYERRRKNSGKRYGQGTFNEKWYLATENGRIRGALLLERHVSINAHGFHRLAPFNGDPPFEYEAIYLMIIYVKAGRRRLYCGECGSRLMVARETEYYTIPAEVCCQDCGLVYEFDDLAEELGKD